MRQRVCIQSQDQGSEAGKHGPQGGSAEEEESHQEWNPEEEGLEEAGVVLEERRRLPMSATGQPQSPVFNHGPQSGAAVPPDRHPQVGKVQQRVQKGHEETQDPQVSCLRERLLI